MNALSKLLVDTDILSFYLTTKNSMLKFLTQFMKNRGMKKMLILIFCMFLNACSFSGAADNEMQSYGEKISYLSGKELKFPDFSIKFVEKREEKISRNQGSPLIMTFYDFEVSKGEKKKKISWSSGTGDIGPTFFEINGANYVLELRQSDIIKGSLGEDVFVIWKKADYEEGLKQKKRLV